MTLFLILFALACFGWALAPLLGVLLQLAVLGIAAALGFASQLFWR